jgi:hypothetical protein
VSGYRTVGEWARAVERGQYHVLAARKVPSQASVAGRWVDLSMAAGNPPANYYASSPLVAATFDTYRGIFHGDAKAPATKHLAELCLQTATAGLVGAYKALDYLLYYPFLDLEDLDDQVLDNTVTLPRYADGDGVMVMAVCVAPTTQGGSFSVDYVDAAGQARTSPVIFTDTTAVNIASVLTNGPGSVAGSGPFLPLAGNSAGVRRITAFRNIAPSGGLAALVLVKPLAEHAIREINSPSEAVWGGPGTAPPAIEDGAFLGLITNCTASVAAGTLAVDGLVTWN